MEAFPKIMGILNVTPDSFSDGGKYSRREVAIEHGLQMYEEGADIIDIGGESTRPGAESVSVDEELGRVIPVIEGLLQSKPEVIVSVDTTKFDVAQAAAAAGAKMINDVSALRFDERVASVAAEYDISLILMHMQGTPRIMQDNPKYSDVVEEVYSELEERISLAQRKGVKKIIADVGIGFGKNLEHNITLLKNLERFKELGVGLMIGISRKSFIGKILGIQEPEERDNATLVLHALMLKSGLDIIRVHNVRNIVMLKKLYGVLNS